MALRRSPNYTHTHIRSYRQNKITTTNHLVNTHSKTKLNQTQPQKARPDRNRYTTDSAQTEHMGKNGPARYHKAGTSSKINRVKVSIYWAPKFSQKPMCKIFGEYIKISVPSIHLF